MAGRQNAVETALRVLRSHDRSAAELDLRLEQRGIPQSERRQALETLERIGYVDDERLARARAEQLAARGSGDALIRHDLEQRGIAADLVEAAIDALAPERERAEAIAARRGASVRTARYLASRGFGADAVEAAVARSE